MRVRGCGGWRTWVCGCRRSRTDPGGIAAALHVPNVMPATVVLRGDGTVAEILPRAFVDADEIAAAVGEALRMTDGNGDERGVRR